MASTAHHLPANTQVIVARSRHAQATLMLGRAQLLFELLDELIFLIQFHLVMIFLLLELAFNRNYLITHLLQVCLVA